MTDNEHVPTHPGSDARVGSHTTPRWVKYLLVALVAAVLGAVLVMLISGGEHGPGRHAGLGVDDATSLTVASPASRS